MNFRKPAIFIIKASSWKRAHLFRNHPEYIAISDLIERYKTEFRFVLAGTSASPSSEILLKNGAIAWDVKTTGRLGSFTYYFGLFKLLFQYRPRIVVIFGLFSILPVTIYSLLSWKSKYVPVFVGELSSQGRKRANQLFKHLGLKALGISLRVSERKILNSFALSKYIQKGIEKLAPTLRGKIGLISYTISSRFCPQSIDVSSRYEEPLILTVAGIEPRKGLDTLIQAISLIPKRFKVVIKGLVRDPVYMRKLTGMVKAFNLQDKVTFITDFFDYDTLDSYYKSATLFVLPSRDECLGVVVLEALHCGLPVVATSVGGISDMIENGVNGVLVKPDNPHELATAISLILNNSTIRKKLAQESNEVLYRRYYNFRITLGEALLQSVSKFLLLK